MPPIYFDPILENKSDEFLNKVIEQSFIFPDISCYERNIKIDYFALYSDPKDYKKENSAVCFYEGDPKYDGFNGIYNAIHFNNTKLLNKYKERFKDVKIFIEPDYSITGNVNLLENLYRKFRAYTVLNYFQKEWGKTVIPQAIFVDKYTKKVLTTVIKPNSIISLSTKGMLKETLQIQLFYEVIDNIINNLKPSKIFIYNVATNSEILEFQLNKLTNASIEVIIPSNKFLNRMLERNNNFSNDKEENVNDLFKE